LLHAQRLPDALVECAHLPLVEGIADRQHRRAVLHFAELRQRRTAYALGRRIRRAQLGVLGLQRLQLAEQLVVLRVGDLRRVLHVVEPVMALEGFAEGFDSFRGAHENRRRASGLPVSMPWPASVWRTASSCAPIAASARSSSALPRSSTSRAPCDAAR